MHGGGHQFRSFSRGIAKHDPLIARAFVFVITGIYPLGDVGRLRVKVAVNLKVGPVEALLLIANVLNALPGDILNPLDDSGGTAHLSADDHTVSGGEGFTRHAGIRVLSEEGIKNSVRDTVTYLVRVAFRYGFGSKQIVLAAHRALRR